MTGPAFDALAKVFDCAKLAAGITVVNAPRVLAALVEKHGASEIMRILTEGGWVEVATEEDAGMIKGGEGPLKIGGYPVDRDGNPLWRLAPVAEEEGNRDRS